MYLELRYCKENDMYYMQTHGADYKKFDTAVKKANKHIKGLYREDHAVERQRLLKKRKGLIEKRNAAVHYTEVTPQDIPEGARIRPMPRQPEQVYRMDDQTYKEMLEQLRQTAQPPDEEET